MGKNEKCIPMVCDQCGNPFLGNRQQANRKRLGRKVGCNLKCTKVLREAKFHRELQYWKYVSDTRRPYS